MTVIARTRFFAGLILILGIVSLLIFILIQNMSHIGSHNAQIGYDEYTVGTPYPGIIAVQKVEMGDQVKKGDILFEVNSPTLTDDITNGRVNAKSFEINDKGNLVLKASNDGMVSKVDFTEGSYVSGTRDIASIFVNGSAYIEGDFKLSPPDYKRLAEGNRVDVLLPNNQKVTASVSDISVKNQDEKAVTVVKAKLDQTLESTSFAAETPVDATLHLGGKTVLDSIGEFISNLLTPRS